MSQMGQYYFDAIERIEGNAGGPVAPLANNVINFVGAGGVTVTGTPLTHTLTITAPGYANSFSTDAGANAVPTLGVINIAGGTNIGTISPGAGNVVTINLDDSISLVGSVTAGTTVTTTAGDITAGNVAVSNLAASFVLSKRRGAGVITSGDYLGALAFQGHDGTAMHTGAYLLATTSGTIALNRIATELSFWTHPDAAGVALQRFTIAANGDITINGFAVAGVVTNSAAGLLSTTATLGVPLGGTGVGTLTDHGVLVGSGVAAITALAVGGTGVILTGVAGADPTWTTATYPATVVQGDLLCASAANVVGVIAGGTAGYVLTANGAGAAPTYQVLPPSFTWSVITADQAGVVDQGFICNKAGLLTVTLPAVFAEGKTMRITGMNTNIGWRIAQQAGQSIHWSTTSTTTVGVGGYLESTGKYDTVEITCSVANTEFIVIGSRGNVTVV